jgi:hypothetical protein
MEGRSDWTMSLSRWQKLTERRMRKRVVGAGEEGADTILSLCGMGGAGGNIYGGAGVC